MKINNLGSYKAVELLFPDEVSSFSRSGRNVTIVRTTWNKRMLPLADQLPELTATAEMDDGGAIHTHECTLCLRSREMTDTLQRELLQIPARGCILVGSTSNGDKRVFGSPSYPLRGTMHEVYGSSREDLHQYELSLTAKMLHGDLVTLS